MSVNVRDLLEAGAHFGHQTHRWNPKMRPYIYGARNGIYIIDLQQTAKLWHEARETIVRTVRSGQKVLFVGTKPQAQDVVSEESTRAGQYYVNKRWLGGMLTNFKTIKTRIDRLAELQNLIDTGKIDGFSKKEGVSLRKDHEKLMKSLSGIREMQAVPGLVIVVDPNREHLAVDEAKKLEIPLVAITDTNCDPDDINYVVPANDDALKSVRLFMHDAADACLEGRQAFEQRIQDESRQKIDRTKTTAPGASSGEGVEGAVQAAQVAGTAEAQTNGGEK